MPEDQDQVQGQDNLKELRRAADEGRTAKAEAEAAKRELAFVKAGVDTDTKIGKLLLKTYEGDLTSEAIKAEALELGAIKAEAPATTATTTASLDEQSQSLERQGLAGEPDVQGDPGPNPNMLAYKAAEAAMAAGQPREIAFGAGLTEMLKAAHAGDTRVILPR